MEDGIEKQQQQQQHQQPQQLQQQPQQHQQEQQQRSVGSLEVTSSKEIGENRKSFWKWPPKFLLTPNKPKIFLNFYGPDKGSHLISFNRWFKDEEEEK